MLRANHILRSNKRVYFDKVRRTSWFRESGPTFLTKTKRSLLRLWPSCSAAPSSWGSCNAFPSVDFTPPDGWHSRRLHADDPLPLVKEPGSGRWVLAISPGSPACQERDSVVADDPVDREDLPTRHGPGQAHEGRNPE